MFFIQTQKRKDTIRSTVVSALKLGIQNFYTFFTQEENNHKLRKNPEIKSAHQPISGLVNRSVRSFFFKLQHPHIIICKCCNFHNDE